MKGCRPLTPDEYTRCIAACGDDSMTRCLLMTGVRTGYRIAELLSLRIADVYDLDTDAVREYVTVAAKDMKGSREGRRVRVHGEAREVIAAHVAHLRSLRRIEAGWSLFPSRKTPPTSTAISLCSRTSASLSRIPHSDSGPPPLSIRAAQARLTSLFRAAGVPHTGSHTLRKTFVARCMQAANGDLRRVQRATGHARIETLCAYYDPSDELVDDMVLSAT